MADQSHAVHPQEFNISFYTLASETSGISRPHLKTHELGCWNAAKTFVENRGKIKSHLAQNCELANTSSAKKRGFSRKRNEKKWQLFGDRWFESVNSSTLIKSAVAFLAGGAKMMPYQTEMCPAHLRGSLLCACFVAALVLDWRHANGSSCQNDSSCCVVNLLPRYFFFF